MQRNYKERTDAELMRDSRTDHMAFDELYLRHAVAVHAQLRRHVPHLAADLTAETFAQAWIARRKFRDDRGGSALPWLLGISRNLLRQSLRSDRAETRAREHLGLGSCPVSDDEYEQVDDALSMNVELRDAWDRLGDQEKEALELRILDELPYSEVAATLKIESTSARSRVHRALRHLGSALQARHEDPPIFPALKSGKGQI